VNSGLIKEIQSDYYPPGRRALKSLTLMLAQPAAYSIAQQANQIVVNIETPPGLLPGRMAIGGLTILGMEARETLISRLNAMGAALQHAAPPVTAKSAQPKPVVITKPVQIPQPVIQPEPQAPVSRKAHGGFWYGLLFGIGGTEIAVTGWRRRRKPVLIRESSQAGAAGVSGMLQAASVLEHLVLKAMQCQGHTVVGSKAIADLGTLWIVQKDDQRQGLVCLGDGGFLERKVLEPFCKSLQQESLRSGTVYALGAFTAPAQAFAKENQIHLISREEVLKLMEVELKGPVLTPDAEQVSQQLVKSQSELDQTQAKIQALEQELSAQKKKWEEAEWYLGEERTKKQTLEQQVAELTKQLAAKDELYAKLVQEADQLKAKSAEIDQRLAGEQEKRTQLETQIGQLEEQLKVQSSTVADLPAPARSASQSEAAGAQAGLSQSRSSAWLSLERLGLWRPARVWRAQALVSPRPVGSERPPVRRWYSCVL
jgi:predicted  nucleic acid-binding Zn-ribbon protein